MTKEQREILDKSIMDITKMNLPNIFSHKRLVEVVHRINPSYDILDVRNRCRHLYRSGQLSSHSLKKTSVVKTLGIFERRFKIRR